MTVADRVAEIRIDAEAPLSQLTLPTVQQIEQLAPFGAGQPAPGTLGQRRRRLANRRKRMGGGERHLSAKTRPARGHAAERWPLARATGSDELAQLTGPFDIAYRPVINEFRGRRNVELHLVDWRPKATGVPDARGVRPSGRNGRTLGVYDVMPSVGRLPLPAILPSRGRPLGYGQNLVS